MIEAIERLLSKHSLKKKGKEMIKAIERYKKHEEPVAKISFSGNAYYEVKDVLNSASFRNEVDEFEKVFNKTKKK